MKSCVLSFSRTGNTKHMAQVIPESLNTKIFDIDLCDVSKLNDFDMLIIGSPIEAFRPTKEISEHIKKMPTVNNRKTIVF